MGTENKFKTVILSLGLWIIATVGIVLTFVELINGHINGVAEFFTTLAFDLVYALIYIILRLIPSVDTRVWFLKAIK